MKPRHMSKLMILLFFILATAGTAGSVFKGIDGLLYALVYGQTLLRWLGLALDDESFQSRHW